MAEASDNNSDQRDFWSGPSGLSWIEHEARQDALLRSVAELVIDRADLVPGGRVPDIGCGTGAVSELAAKAVGETGVVLATDISEPLLHRAGERLAGYPQASTHLGDAATVEWPKARFDFALSRFGVMFFSDPPSAIGHIAEALRPGGRMVFAAWASVGENPYWSIGAKAARSRLGALPASPSNVPGPMGFADVSYVDCVFREAGLTDVHIEPTTIALDYPYPATDLAELMVSLGPARRVINAFDASDADVSAIQGKIAEMLEPFEHGKSRVLLPALINLIEVTVP